jgi:hypothetical protein
MGMKPWGSAGGAFFLALPAWRWHRWLRFFRPGRASRITGGRGLGRAPKIGERFQAVGYINRTDDSLFRPVVFWYGVEPVPVNQVLGDTLPVRAPLPR